MKKILSCKRFTQPVIRSGLPGNKYLRSLFRINISQPLVQHQKAKRRFFPSGEDMLDIEGHDDDTLYVGE